MVGGRGVAGAREVHGTRRGRAALARWAASLTSPTLGVVPCEFDIKLLCTGPGAGGRYCWIPTHQTVSLAARPVHRIPFDRSFRAGKPGPYASLWPWPNHGSAAACPAGLCWSKPLLE